MQLRNLLQNPNTINLVKRVSQKSIETQKCNIEALKLITQADLVVQETKGKNQEETCIVTITPKGKEFIALFDQLVILFKPQAQPLQELTPEEKKILSVCGRLEDQAGPVAVKSLALEYTPYEAYETSLPTLARRLTRLEKKGCIQRKQEGTTTYVTLTTKGQAHIQTPTQV
jgi:predicted transcriptional regulator